MKKPVIFGKYLLLERLNVGGMAEVFVAKAFGVEGFERILAIKRILPTMAEDQEFINMFIDEARISVQLNHANIVHIHELGKYDDAYYIAMEYVPGRDLRTIVEHFRRDNGAMPVPQAVYIASKICEGLDYAHRRKDALGQELRIIHRDISPQNILVSYDGEVKLIDFGIAKAANRSQKTQAGILKGKFGYMSPEQVRGNPIDRRSDVFAVGVILYESLTGEKLFVGESDFSTLEKVRNAEVPRPRSLNPEIPAGLETIVMRALSREPDERYQWASELQEDLMKFLLARETLYSGKHLAAFMKELFPGELARENARMKQFAAVQRPAELEATGIVAAPTTSSRAISPARKPEPDARAAPNFSEPTALIDSKALGHGAAPVSPVPSETILRPLEPSGVHTSRGDQPSNSGSVSASKKPRGQVIIGGGVMNDGATAIQKSDALSGAKPFDGETRMLPADDATSGVATERPEVVSASSPSRARPQRAPSAQGGEPSQARTDPGALTEALKLRWRALLPWQQLTIGSAALLVLAIAAGLGLARLGGSPPAQLQFAVGPSNAHARVQIASLELDVPADGSIPVPPGRYRVVVAAPGFVSQTFEVDAAPATAVRRTVALESTEKPPRSGSTVATGYTLILTSPQPDIVLMMDNKVVGMTPELRLSDLEFARTYRVLASKDGFRSQSIIIENPERKPELPISFELQKDDAESGAEPGSADKKKTQKQRTNVDADGPRNRSGTSKTTEPTGSTTAKSTTPPPRVEAGSTGARAARPSTSGKTGKLICSTTKAGAEVIVDGQPVGARTPVVLSNPVVLPVGKHSVSFRLNGRTSRAQDVTITEDVPSRLINVPVE